MNSAHIRRVIAAGMIGNVFEWYDFAIYGYFAAQIGRHFFPHDDAVAQLLSAFGVFAIGYLVRPIGGVLVGHIGDRFGRRTALIFSVTAMAIPTFLMGLLPGHQTIGVLAPIGLSLLRIVQGLSVGGEYASSMVFLVEHAQLGQLGLVLLSGLYYGALPATLVEAAPPTVRCTAVALGYNLCVGLFGGLSPLVATWLVERTGNEIAPAFLIMASAAVTFVTRLNLRETYRAPFGVAPRTCPTR